MSLESTLNKLIDDNEHFLGKELDDKQMERYQHLRELCLKVTRGEPRIKTPLVPFSNRSQNATVQLDMPAPMWIFNETVSKTIGEIISSADDVAFAVVEKTGHIRISCSILRMWKKFGYTNDMENGK